MTQYFTDFSEYTTDAQPSDWTERFVTANVAWTVRDSVISGVTGGKVLEVNNSTTGRHGLSWDDIDADANRDNVECLIRFRAAASNPGNFDVRPFGRGSGAAASESAYFGGKRFATSTSTHSTGKYVSGTFTQLSTIGITLTVDTWYWVRFRINGTTVESKLWEDGDAEPGSFDRVNTDSDVTGVGWVGLFVFDATQTLSLVDIFSVGTNGDTAPSSDPGGGGSTAATKDKLHPIGAGFNGLGDSLHPIEEGF